MKCLHWKLLVKCRFVPYRSIITSTSHEAEMRLHQMFQKLAYATKDSIKVKGKSCPWALAHEDVLETADIATRILNLDARCRWMVSFTP